MVRIFKMLLAVLLLFGVGEAFAAKSEQFTDPMRPVRYQAPVATSSVEKDKEKQVDTKAWQLTSVLISSQRSVAVINGKALQEGEVLDGYKVVQIEPDNVLLKNKYRKIILRRAGTGLKKISPGQDVGKGSKP